MLPVAVPENTTLADGQSQHSPPIPASTTRPTQHFSIRKSTTQLQSRGKLGHFSAGKCFWKAQEGTQTVREEHRDLEQTISEAGVQQSAGAAKVAHELHSPRVWFQLGSSGFNTGLLIKTDCSSPKGNSTLALHCTNTGVPVWLAMSQISLLIQFKPSPSQGGTVDFPSYQLWYSFEPTMSHYNHLNQQKISTTKGIILLPSETECP